MSRRRLFARGAARLVPPPQHVAAVGAAWRGYEEAAGGRPDPEALRRWSAAAWGEGDPAASSRGLAPAADALVAAAAVAPGQAVLDVGAGDGNLALAAAARGARVTAIDVCARQVEAGRERAVGVDWHVGDAERLPFADGAFDCVLSSFGAMFAPRPRETARELARVARPGGVVGMANWSSTGFMGRLLDLAAELAPPPAGAARPARWGRYESAFLWLDREVAGFAMTDAELTLEYESAGDAWAALATAPGPFAVAARGSPDRARAAFGELLARFARGPAVSVPAAYVLVTGRAPAAARSR